MSHPPRDDWDEHDVRGAGAHADDVLGFRGDREHDASLADEMLEPPPPHETFRPRRRQRRNPVLKVLALLVAAERSFEHYEALYAALMAAGL